MAGGFINKTNENREGRWFDIYSVCVCVCFGHGSRGERWFEYGAWHGNGQSLYASATKFTSEFDVLAMSVTTGLSGERFRFFVCYIW